MGHMAEIRQKMVAVRGITFPHHQFFYPTFHPFIHCDSEHDEVAILWVEIPYFENLFAVQFH